MMLPSGLALRLFLTVASFLLITVESRGLPATRTNKMRYGDQPESAEPTPILAHMLHLASSISSRQQASQSNQNEQFHEGRFLDEEDKRLLDEFYRNTKQSDPFLDTDELSFDSLWADEQAEREREISRPEIETGNQRHDKPTAVREELSYDGWTFDERILDGVDGKPFVYNLGPVSLDDNSLKANYSPNFDLLTTYNPIQQAANSTADQRNETSSSQMDLSRSSNRIVGATLFGQDHNSKPSVSSKSAQDAIRLHNDMLRPPPNDGKVRVRMYYHRAIHDDSKLYGTGPWKYWGHGWGLEFGYDPRKQDKDFYQRGYTIERAFGRDFCKDQKNCRKPDPNFFRDPNGSVGKYSEQYFRDAKRKPQQIVRQHQSVGYRAPPHRSIRVPYQRDGG